MRRGARMPQAHQQTMSQCHNARNCRTFVPWTPPPPPHWALGWAVITMGKMPFLLCSLPILGMGAVEQWDGVNTLHWSERRAVGHCPIVTTIAPWSRGLEGCGDWRAGDSVYTAQCNDTEDTPGTNYTGQGDYKTGQDRVII